MRTNNLYDSSVITFQGNDYDFEHAGIIIHKNKSVALVGLSGCSKTMATDIIIAYRLTIIRNCAIVYETKNGNVPRTKYQ